MGQGASLSILRQPVPGAICESCVDETVFADMTITGQVLCQPCMDDLSRIGQRRAEARRRRMLAAAEREVTP